MGSLDQTVAHALWPVLSSGLLAPALAWALAAVVLPWINRGAVPVRLVSIAMWSAGLASATTTMLRVLHAGTPPRPGAVALGALAGGILAFVPTLLSGGRNASASSDTAAGLA